MTKSVQIPTTSNHFLAKDSQNKIFGIGRIMEGQLAVEHNWLTSRDEKVIKELDEG